MNILIYIYFFSEAESCIKRDRQWEYSINTPFPAYHLILEACHHLNLYNVGIEPTTVALQSRAYASIPRQASTTSSKQYQIIYK